MQANWTIILVHIYFIPLNSLLLLVCAKCFQYLPAALAAFCFNLFRFNFFTLGHGLCSSNNPHKQTPRTHKAHKNFLQSFGLLDSSTNISRGILDQKTPILGHFAALAPGIGFKRFQKTYTWLTWPRHFQSFSHFPIAPHPKAAHPERVPCKLASVISVAWWKQFVGILGKSQIHGRWNHKQVALRVFPVRPLFRRAPASAKQVLTLSYSYPAPTHKYFSWATSRFCWRISVFAAASSLASMFWAQNHTYKSYKSAWNLLNLAIWRLKNFCSRDNLFTKTSRSSQGALSPSGSFVIRMVHVQSFDSFLSEISSTFS